MKKLIIILLFLLFNLSYSTDSQDKSAAKKNIETGATATAASDSKEKEIRFDNFAQVHAIKGTKEIILCLSKKLDKVSNINSGGTTKIQEYLTKLKIVDSKTTLNEYLKELCIELGPKIGKTPLEILNYEARQHLDSTSSTRSEGAGSSSQLPCDYLLSMDECIIS